MEVANLSNFTMVYDDSTIYTTHYLIVDYGTTGCNEPHYHKLCTLAACHYIVTACTLLASSVAYLLPKQEHLMTSYIAEGEAIKMMSCNS